ncbi:uncharacterized protein LOC133187812 [Saccostrea echinata]|uniref:uncharacterized protein LOC133187812 n=1 Tax=Saccostrea echinata TaxID=191078 RepID=UPI002A83915D|nr:uncharacterized protein LOC133187812 [Saccostrea echinata]
MDTFVFLFSLLKAVAVTGTVMCPYLSLWEARSKMFCKEKPTWYHCLENQAGDLREACLEPVPIGKGYYPVLSLDLDFIKPVKCPPTHYQSKGQMSNYYKSITCMYPKSLCDDDGEEKCDDGSNIKDRMCRCDYTKGYRSNVYLFSNPLNASCYQSKSEEVGCVMFACPEGQELNPAYYCVKKCSYGYYRKKHGFNCVKNFSIPSSTVQYTTKSSVTAKDLTQKPKINDIPDDLMVTSNENSFFKAAAIGSPVLSVVIVVFIIFVIFQRRKKGWCSDLHGSRNTVQETEMERISSNEDHSKEGKKYIVVADTFIENLIVHEAENMMIGDNNRIVKGSSSECSHEQ